MAEIYLFHPKHGVKIATMEMEAQYDEQNGWTRFDPEDMVEDEPAAPEPEPLIETSEPANVLVEPRRRGRPRVAKSE
jgi:hypothetical protein